MKDITRLHLEKLLQKYPCLYENKDVIIETFQSMLDCYNNKGMILLCGNGGSASDCNHIVGELMKGFLKKRELTDAQKETFLSYKNIAERLQQGIPAISLCEHSALITAYNNDVDPEMVFAQQVFGLGQNNDIVIGISTSGNAKNVTNALTVAKTIGLKTIALTGKHGGKSKAIADISICVPEQETYLIQELHLPIYHCLCAMLEEEIF